jgi:HPt (histidine-containing phosphotransfer) domain-containing protein
MSHLDLELIEELRDLMAEEFGLLIQTFVEDGEQRVRGLSDLVGDRQALRRAVHSLKGGASNIGATELSRLCGELEATADAQSDELQRTLILAIASEFAAVAGVLATLR